MLLGEITAYLSKKRSKDERKAAYFVLGKVGKNIGSTECSHVLLQYVLSEKNKYALSTALDMIADLPLKESEDITPISSLLLNDRWIVRYSAIRALRSAPSPESESNLIALLKCTQDDYDKVYCHSALSVIGTERSLPVIQSSVSSRKKDVKESAAYAIENIQRRIRVTVRP
jgi:HEAT repeat protein